MLYYLSQHVAKPKMIFSCLDEMTFYCAEKQQIKNKMPYCCGLFTIALGKKILC